MIPTTKSKTKRARRGEEETNQGPIKETSKWAQQSDLRATQRRRGRKPDGRRVVGKQFNGMRSVYTFNNCANNSEKAEKKIKLKGHDDEIVYKRREDVGGSQGVFMRPGKSGLRVTFDTTLSELTIKDSNVICATTLAPK